MGSVTTRRLIVGALALVLALGLAIYGHSRQLGAGAAASPDQGCVNQGADRRLFATVICGAQRHLSWKSDHEPYFLLIGNPAKTSVGLAWPPYFVFNSPRGNGQWRMFRMGFRYDRSWRGYIFPTIAWKTVREPLRY